MNQYRSHLTCVAQLWHVALDNRTAQSSEEQHTSVYIGQLHAITKRRYLLIVYSCCNHRMSFEVDRAAAV